MRTNIGRMLLALLLVAPSQLLAQIETPTATATVTPTATPTATVTPSPSPSPAALSAIDQTYLIAAAQGDRYEIAVAELALLQSTNARIRRIAQRLITDHTASLAAVTALADANAVTIPEGLNAEQALVLDGLGSFSGRRFDRQFTRLQDCDHERAIFAAQTEVDQGTNPQVVQNASNQLPVLRRHLSQIRAAQNRGQAARRRRASR